MTFNDVQGPFKPYYQAAAAVDVVVKGQPGFLKGILVGDAVGSSVIEISDHATDGDGNVVVYLAGSTLGPAYYDVNLEFAAGITADITLQTHVTFIYK